MSTHWVLRLIHILYVALATVASWVQRHRRRRPKPLAAHRGKIPKHLCLNLVANDETPTQETETAFLECLQSVAAWCRVLGIEILTVYDRHGVLYRSSENAHRHVLLGNEEDSCESEVEYPLTPPHSEPSGSRPHSPERAVFLADSNTITMVHLSRLRKRRNVGVRRRPKAKSVASTFGHLTLHIASRASGKPGIVSASRSLLRSYVSGASTSDNATSSRFPCNLTVSKLDTVLGAALPPPDLMIIHHIGGMNTPYPPIEFHGFPPWQNSLTEFHRTHPDDGHFGPSPAESLTMPVLISEAAFCRALDEYSGAEFRLGRCSPAVRSLLSGLGTHEQSA